MTYKLTVTTLALTAITSTVAATHAKPDTEHPHIVLILCDDMGFSDLSCYGGEIHTPNIDYLAEQGIRFSQFKNTGRSCPSRAALLTGHYQHEWKSHSTLTLLATQNYPFLLKYDCPLWLK